MRVIKLKDGWNSRDSKLVINDKITETGKTNYWAAVDASFKFNVLKRDLFMAKSAVSAAAAGNPKIVQNQSKDNRTVLSKSHVASHSGYPAKDPMQDFFKRRHYAMSHEDSDYDHEERHRDVREDRRDRRRFQYERFDENCRSFNRFALPRPR